MSQVPDMPEQRREIAPPEDYVATFVGFKPGQNVLEDLVARFHDRPIWVAGGEEARRETEKRAAQKEVIGFILRRLGQIKEDADAA